MEHITHSTECLGNVFKQEIVAGSETEDTNTFKQGASEISVKAHALREKQ